MDINEYQKKALTTAIFNSDPLMDKTIWAMGISGEAGELLDKWKKIVAYRDGEYNEDDLKSLKREMGDVVWYIALFAHSLGISMDEVLKLNIEKLSDRKLRGVTKGEGDNR